MENLTQIIKDDFGKVGQVFRDIIIGAIQGIYTPALMNTGVRQINNGLKDYDKSTAKNVSKCTAQTVSACSVGVGVAGYAIQQGQELEYFGVLATTNAIDYLVHAYKRSKK